MKHLKAFLLTVVMLITAISFTACLSNSGGTFGGGTVIGGETETNGSDNDAPSGSVTETPDTGSSDNTGSGGNTEEPAPPQEEKANILIVYFSCTNTTKGRAETLQARLNADIYRITPAIPYTSDDLNYSNNSCRANREQRDASCRPEISGRVDNIDKYGVIYIGYPIWWSQAPKIIYTFLESYDLDGVTVIPFCTSGGSSMGTSGTNLHGSAPNAIWKSGCLVRSASDIDALVNMK